MKAIAFLVLFVFNLQIASASDDGMISTTNFVVSAPETGTYVPWQYGKCFAGEIITINGSSFHYSAFSDVVDLHHPLPDCSGPLLVFKDHIYLNNTNVPDPYLIAGKLDGDSVLLDRLTYRFWKETGKVSKANILFIEERVKSKQ